MKNINYYLEKKYKTTAPIYYCLSLAFFILFLFANELRAAKNQMPAYWNVKFGGWPKFVDNNRTANRAHFDLQCNKRIHYLFEVGLSANLFSDFNNTLSKGYLKYGLAGNWHFLPLIINHHGLRFEPYLSGKLGYTTYFNAAKDKKNMFPRYFFGAGFAYYLTKHVGVYFEYGFDKPFESQLELKYLRELSAGISIKL